MRVSSDMPDDVLVLHDALEQLREYKKSPITNNSSFEELRHGVAFSAGPYSPMLSGRTDYPYRRSATHGAGRQTDQPNYICANTAW